MSAGRLAYAREYAARRDPAIDERQSPRISVFNVVEGVVNHQILGIHHVRDDLGAPLSWDIGFLVLGVLLSAGGWLLHQRGLRALERVRVES